MTFYLVGGAGASPTPTIFTGHLPSLRTHRYPSDTTDAEWQLVAPLIPAGHPGRRGGRRPVHSRRDIVDAIRYLAHNGCVWRALPADFPPWQTVYDDHARWSSDGTVNHLHNSLRDQARAAAARESPAGLSVIGPMRWWLPPSDDGGQDPTLPGSQFSTGYFRPCRWRAAEEIMPHLRCV